MRAVLGLIGCLLLAGCLTSGRPLVAPEQADFPLPNGATLIQTTGSEPDARELGRARLTRESNGYRLRAQSGSDFFQQDNTLFQLKKVASWPDSALFALQSKDESGSGWRYASVTYWPKTGIAYLRTFDGVPNCKELRDHGLLRKGMADNADGCSVPDFATLADVLKQDSTDRAVNTSSKVYRVK